MIDLAAKTIVGISDAKVSADPDDSLVTYSLGSCIAVALYDAQARVGGMLHYQLPSSSADPARAKERPLMFADTGMEVLLAKMAEAGAFARRLRVWIAGASQMLGQATFFDIGRRNHAAIRKVLWQRGLFIEREHVGGNLPRTMCLKIADGSVTIKHGIQSVTI